MRSCLLTQSECDVTFIDPIDVSHHGAKYKDALLLKMFLYVYKNDLPFFFCNNRLSRGYLFCLIQWLYYSIRPWIWISWPKYRPNFRPNFSKNTCLLWLGGEKNTVLWKCNGLRKAPQLYMIIKVLSILSAAHVRKVWGDSILGLSNPMAQVARLLKLGK